MAKARPRTARDSLLPAASAVVVEEGHGDGILVQWRDQAAAEQPAASRFVPCTHRSCAKPHLQL